MPYDTEIDGRNTYLSSRLKASGSLRIAVGIATRGRPQVLIATIGDLSRQSRLPDSIIVAYADSEDISGAPEQFPGVTFLRSSLGLTRQRNAILDNCCEADIVTFLDDDFYLEARYLEVVERVFIEEPRVVAATGNVLADGIQGPGLLVKEATDLLLAVDSAEQPQIISNVFNAYGCNMSLRIATIESNALRFDEQLPLYGWYEDVEFSRQLAPYGSIVRISTACGVHLGTKSGRSSGLRLGYSQVANPLYLARKGSIPWSFAIASMLSRSAKNAVRSLSPEPYVDRRGRLRGNLKAFKELLGGKLSPSNIINL